MTIYELEKRLEELKKKLDNATDIASVINEMCAISYEIGKLTK